MTQGSTRARVLHWFVRGGVARSPDGAEVETDGDAAVGGRDEGARIVLCASAERSASPSFERDDLTELARAKGILREGARQREAERHHLRAYLREYAIEKS